MVKIKKGHEVCIVPETAYRELYADKGWERVDEPDVPCAIIPDTSKKCRRRGADKNDSNRGT